MDWVELGAVYHPGTSSGSYPFQSISGLCFDLLEERLWLHDSDGYLASYTVPECLPYSSIRTCWGTTYDDTEWGITSLSRTVVRPISCARSVRGPWHCLPAPPPRHSLSFSLTHIHTHTPPTVAVSLTPPPHYLPASAVAWLCQ